MRVFVLIIFFSFPIFSWANPNNVIFVTFDGVRGQEVFRKIPLLRRRGLPKKTFRFLKKSFREKGIIYGATAPFSRYKIASNIAISLPSYQAIFFGEDTGCRNNHCEQVTKETFPERIQRELNLKREDVAVIASWNRIPYAFLGDDIFINAGLTPLDDGSDDPLIKEINKKQQYDIPLWPGARKDKYTMAHAIHYLKKHQPRFLYISLDDSDEWGHRNDYKNYVHALENYDNFLKRLFTTVEELGDYGKHTTVIVTTDHNRGKGPFFKDHGTFPFTEKKVWLYAHGPYVKRRGRVRKRGTHHFIRPTIETLFGLRPAFNAQEKKNRKVFREILP